MATNIALLRLHFTTVDVFTSTPYTGNPLAIVRLPTTLPSPLTQTQKQLIAREFNLSETIFLHDRSSHEPEWTVDIFTTTDELPFAGHPTIGAAVYVLLIEGRAGSDGVGSDGSGGKGRTGKLKMKAGIVQIFASEDGKSVTAEIPCDVHVHARTIGDLQSSGSETGRLSRDLGLKERETKAPIVSIVKGMTFLLVDVGSLELLGRVKSTHGKEGGFHQLLDKEGGWDEGFVARYYFMVGGEDRGVVRVRSRMVELSNEDPATGSAACALGSWLALQRGRSTRFEVEQGVEMGRRSVIGVEVELDQEGKKVLGVKLKGEAVQVMEGTVRF